MNISRSALHYTAAFCLAFLSIGFLHVFFLPLSRLTIPLYMGLTVLWCFTVQQRITGVRMRCLLLSCAAMILLQFFLQFIRYHFTADDSPADILLWYACYIPMTLIPLLIFYVSLYMNIGDRKRITAAWYLLLIPAAALMGFILTNSSHGFCFFFSNGVPDNGSCSYGPVYFLWLIWTSVLLLISYAVMLQKCTVAGTEKYGWVPALPAIPAAAVLVSYRLTNHPITMCGATVFDIGEVFGFLIIGYLEGCIQIGMIPSNIGYNALFQLAGLQAELDDTSQKARLCTGGMNPLSDEVKNAARNGPVLWNADARISATEISGGYCYRQDDLSDLNRLNEHILELREQTEVRNEMLHSENEVYAEHARVEAQNALYDRIALAVRPQTEAVLRLLDEPLHGDVETESRFSRVALYNAYMKRRSNLEVLAGTDRGTVLAGEELILSLQEYFSCLRLCGVETFLTGSAQGSLHAETVIDSFELLEILTEYVLPDISAMAVHLSRNTETLVLRIMLQAKEKHTISISERVWNKAAGFGCGENGGLSVRTDGTGCTVRLVIPEGGSAV